MFTLTLLSIFTRVCCVHLASAGVTSHVVCDPSSVAVIKYVNPSFSVIVELKSAEDHQLGCTPSLYKICFDCDSSLMNPKLLRDGQIEWTVVVTIIHHHKTPSGEIKPS